MDITCVECGSVGDRLTHFVFPHETSTGICREFRSCDRRKEAKRKSEDGRGNGRAPGKLFGPSAKPAT